MVPKFSILISTKNRLPELKITLGKLQSILEDHRVECFICDDGSTDSTSQFIREKYPSIQLITHAKSKGYIFSRNELLGMTQAQYAISLDDDAHFLSDLVLENIQIYFEQHKTCGLIACRIFWGKENPVSIATSEETIRVQGFVGCGHVWNMKAWRSIPNYPEWFIFYGEEDYASYQLFKKNWEVHYVPTILVQHRVEVKSRRSQKDYGMRLRNSLRAGWYNYLLFLPWSEIPRRFIYTFYMQLKLKVFKGDLRAAIAVLKALGDLITHLPKLARESNRLSISEFKEYESLAKTRIYWELEE